MTTSVPAYPAISQYPRGGYLWAMDQLEAGNEMRRWGWPIEVDVCDKWPDLHIERAPRVWKVFQADDYPRQGFSNSCWGGEGGDRVVGIGSDGGFYTPTEGDKAALDWQYVYEVTAEQIDMMDRNRFTHVPYADPDEAYENNSFIERTKAYHRFERRMVLGAILLAVVIIAVAASNWK